jgi:hypothetical protein
VLWRRPGQRGSATAAPLRLALSPHAGPHVGPHMCRLAVHVLKRRGAELPQPVLIDVGDIGRPAFTPAATFNLPPPPASSVRLAAGTQ